MEERILIVSNSEKSADALANILKRYGFNNTDFASGGTEAKRIVLRTVYDLVIINSPLKDGQGSELAVDFVCNTTGMAILIVKSDIADVVAAKVEDYGVIVIPKPLEQGTFLSSVRLALSFRQRMQKLIDINTKYEKKYEELRMVSRAKCILIEKEGMTEQEAHRYIEKFAMDKRESKALVASDIIKRYI